MSPIEADPDEPVRMDPAGYLVVIARHEAGTVVCEHYDHTRLHVVEGGTATDVYREIVERDMVSRLDHAAYLGGSWRQRTSPSRSDSTKDRTGTPSDGLVRAPKRRPLPASILGVDIETSPVERLPPSGPPSRLLPIPRALGTNAPSRTDCTSVCRFAM